MGMGAKLEKEAQSDATEKAYCDEEMFKTEAKKVDLQDNVAKLTAKIDRNAATSAKRKEEVKELQSRLASLAREQAKMDQIRAEENTDYIQAKQDLELGLSGIQKALGLLRDYFGGAAALVQEDQPAKPEKHEKSAGAGQSIISMLEVLESDFSETLAKVETEEADAAAEYEKTTQENKIAKTTMAQDAKYKAQEATSLDKEVAELTSDKDTTSTEPCWNTIPNSRVVVSQSLRVIRTAKPDVKPKLLVSRRPLTCWRMRLHLFNASVVVSEVSWHHELHISHFESTRRPEMLA